MAVGRFTSTYQTNAAKKYPQNKSNSDPQYPYLRERGKAVAATLLSVSLGETILTHPAKEAYASDLTAFA